MKARIAALLSTAALITGLTSVAVPAQAAPAEQTTARAAAGYPASLPSGCNKKSARGNSHLVVCSQPYGDRIWVYDGAKDGRSAVAVWKGVDFDRSCRCINSLGRGHWGYCDYNFPEGHAIGLSGYTQNGGKGKQYNILFPASYTSTS